ncbi:DUF736 family protein [Leptospira interrogans]|uniref:DUF736 family protein n=1 Tax=Leptospira interrogans TaxID=173 RepID=UPI001EF03BA6|nr:DUF736 family protein [Leptospira interrogans]ULG87910.1 DUF736 family protein [Leptospira interrogans]
MSKTLGCMEAREDKGGKKFYNLEVSFPFCPKAEFYVAENAKKNSPEAKENPPDYLVYYAKNQVGALWKRTFDNGAKEYLSAEIIAPSFPEGKVNFALFPQKETEGRYDAVFSDPKEMEKRREREKSEEKVPY